MVSEEESEPDVLVRDRAGLLLTSKRLVPYSRPLISIRWVNDPANLTGGLEGQPQPLVTG